MGGSAQARLHSEQGEPSHELTRCNQHTVIHHSFFSPPHSQNTDVVVDPVTQMEQQRIHAMPAGETKEKLQAALDVDCFTKTDLRGSTRRAKKLQLVLGPRN